MASLPPWAANGRGGREIPYSERSLSDHEKAELRRIRENRRIRNARREIQNDNYFGHLIGGLIVVGLVIAALGWPLAVWHRTLPDGSMTPDSLGWVIEVVWLAICATLFALYKRADAKAKRAKPPAERTSPEDGGS